MRSVYACVFELPDGEHVIAVGPCKREKAVSALRQWIGRNPEAVWSEDAVRPVTKPELDDLTKSIADKYPRRKPLASFFNGVAMSAFELGYRVPGSKQKPPAYLAPVAGAWGKLGSW